MEEEGVWERLCYKHSGLGAESMSPIRPCTHLVGDIGGILKEDVGKALLWTLLNSEEFHYQNSCVIVVHNSDDPLRLKTVLNDQRSLIKWRERLVEHRFLGEGQYGQVYKAKDKLTNEIYAIKGVKPLEDEYPEDNPLTSLFKFLSFLLFERNIFAELNHSPFFVRMISSFEHKDTSYFWFVLDFCICDLEKLLSLYSLYNDPDQLVEDYQDSKSLEKISIEMTEFLGTDYSKLIFIYFFEMLSALHYLASFRIIHADIKLENILISKNGHIKLADFGVSYRNHWFDRNSIVMLPQNLTEMEEAEEKDKKFKKQGTVDYYDPELVIDDLITEDVEGYEMLKNILEESTDFQNISNMHQNFMSDLFAVGMVVFELMTGGLIFTKNFIPQEDEIVFWGIQIIYNEKIRKQYLQDILKEFSKCKEILSVLNFILTIFTPREIRAKEFTKEVTVFHQKKRVLEQFIDIHKVEQITYYNSKSITKENVLNIIFPDNFLDTLNNEFKPRGKKVNIFDEKNSRKNKKLINLHTFNYN